MTTKPATTAALEQAAKDYIDRGEYDAAITMLKAIPGPEYGLKIEDLPGIYRHMRETFPGKPDAEQSHYTKMDAEQDKRDESWIDFDVPGACPTYAGKIIEVMTRIGSKACGAAGKFSWVHFGHGSDIIKYRIL